ncbi:cytochrome P450 [Streptosporangium sp. NPDC051023]|uniref:cytochrome P450 n=1 Tax=Streptosporangium sp. NPDC051023 TaxID=3155410 RepID=UPI0034507713
MDLAPEYGQWRARQGLVKVRPAVGDEAWLVTRHEDARAVLGDVRFSSDMTAPGYPKIFVPPLILPGAFIALDPPEHTRLRAMLVREFTTRRMQALRPRVQEIVDTTLDVLSDGPAPADLVAGFARPVTALVICELLGVPAADQKLFLGWTETLHRRDVPVSAHEEANQALFGYMEALVTAKAAEPTEDLVGRLVVERVRTGELSQEELVAFALLLLAGGLDTTANVIGLSALSLLRDAGQLAALAADPTLVEGAVEEMMRFHTITQWGIGRAATADVEVGGTLVRTGEGLIVLLPSANRDESVFPDPDRFDVRRDARGHLALGHGVHHCIGQGLARLELQVAMGTLVRRLPGLALAEDIDHVRFQDDMFVYGVRRLHVTW